MPVTAMLQQCEPEHNLNPQTRSNYISDDEFTVDDILALLADMNGKSGYAEMMEAWSVWDTLTRSADAETRARMLEACRQFAVSRASATTIIAPGITPPRRAS